MEKAKEIINNKIDTLQEKLEWLCIENSAEDYQFTEYYQIEILKEILQEFGG